MADNFGGIREVSMRGSQYQNTRITVSPGATKTVEVAPIVYSGKLNASNPLWDSGTQPPDTGEERAILRRIEAHASGRNASGGLVIPPTITSDTKSVDVDKLFNQDSRNVGMGVFSLTVTIKSNDSFYDTIVDVNLDWVKFSYYLAEPNMVEGALLLRMIDMF